MPKLTFSMGALLLIVIVGCKKTPEKIVSINPNEFGVEEQILVGNTFKKVIDSNPEAFEILSRNSYPEAYNYLSTVFYTLLNTSSIRNRLDFEWTVNIVQDDSIRTAFFLPGGHFYIYSGLLKYIDSESQLLGIVGHELFYTDSDILIRKMSDEFGGTTIGDILLGNEVENLKELSLAMPYLIFDEKNVFLADSFAVHLICPFQYEPFGIKTIIEKADSDSRSLLWLTTRQSNRTNRILHIEQQAAQCGFPGIDNKENYQKFVKEYLP